MFTPPLGLQREGALRAPGSDKTFLDYMKWQPFKGCVSNASTQMLRSGRLPLLQHKGSIFQLQYIAQQIPFLLPPSFLLSIAYLVYFSFPTIIFHVPFHLSPLPIPPLHHF